MTSGNAMTNAAVVYAREYLRETNPLLWRQAIRWLGGTLRWEWSMALWESRLNASLTPRNNSEEVGTWEDFEFEPIAPQHFQAFSCLKEGDCVESWGHALCSPAVLASVRRVSEKVLSDLGVFQSESESSCIVVPAAYARGAVNRCSVMLSVRDFTGLIEVYCNVHTLNTLEALTGASNMFRDPSAALLLIFLQYMDRETSFASAPVCDFVGPPTGRCPFMNDHMSRWFILQNRIEHRLLTFVVRVSLRAWSRKECTMSIPLKTFEFISRGLNETGLL